MVEVEVEEGEEGGGGGGGSGEGGGEEEEEEVVEVVVEVVEVEGGGGLWPVTCRHSVSSCCSGFSMSQQRTVWSKEPDASSRPLGEKRTVYTAPVCPRRSYL